MQFLKKKAASGFEVCLKFFSLLSDILHLPNSSFFVRMKMDARMKSTEMQSAQAEFQKIIYGLKAMAKKLNASDLKFWK